MMPGFSYLNDHFSSRVKLYLCRFNSVKDVDMNLVIDYGNSAVKVGIFDHQTLLKKHTFLLETDAINFLKDAKVEHAIISSVKTNSEIITSWLKNEGKTFVLSQHLPLPIKNLYKTPETLGVDRLAAVCGAMQVFPLQNVLVIDAGTCITFEFIDKNGSYHGGAISPGLNMRFQAVHAFTARLPLVKPAGSVNLIGSSTESCIQSGVVNGLLAEMDGIINRYRSEFDGLQVILCGGDAAFFENKLKASIFASPELVLVGLNSILIYNVTH
jgi:type III pantothenate kinase